MSESYVELLVKKKKTPKDSILKGLMIAGIVILVLIGLVIPLVLIAAIALGVLAYFKMPGLDLEFEYL